jgi:hypothetical protein
MDGSNLTGILCLVPSANSPGKHDQSGAFLPEAHAFARFHGADPTQVVRYFDPAQDYAGRRASCNAAIRALRVKVDALAFFCHGFRRGIQAGYLLGHVGDLADLLGQHMRPGGWVLLYACDTGRDGDDDTRDERLPGPGGDGGFADALRDACEDRGLRISVMGHSTAGHCTMNPNARRFVPGTGRKGGDWYVDPTNPQFLRWQAALRSPRSTLRWRFPVMTPAELSLELAQGA